MARRNLFQPPAPPAAPPAAPSAGQSDDKAPEAEAKPRFPNTGAMNGVKSTLRDLSSNAVRDIPVEMIDDGGPKDRLSFTDKDVAELADSIRQHGQQVPIMVRPLTDRPGHYRVVYGRRRLRALQVLNLPAKALVRSLSDQEAVLAQGQENSHRLDPSFIEKALFAAELANDSYDQAIILDALAIDKPMLSRMAKVARAIPQDIIQFIGSAHGIGRRRWEELADVFRADDSGLDDLIHRISGDEAKTSDERFALVCDAVTGRQKTSVGKPAVAPALSIRLGDGTQLAEIRETARALTVKLSKSDAPEFAQWIRDNAQTELTRLYEAWKSDKKTD